MLNGGRITIGLITLKHILHYVVVALQCSFFMSCTLQELGVRFTKWVVNKMETSELGPADIADQFPVTWYAGFALRFFIMWPD